MVEETPIVLRLSKEEEEKLITDKEKDLREFILEFLGGQK